MDGDTIRQMMAGGEVERARAELEAVLAVSPGDVEARLLLGTCRQLLGDEAGFRRVHDELAPELDRREAAGETSCVIEAWRKYRTLFRYVAAAGLVIGATTILCGCYGVPASNRPATVKDSGGH